jgi:hypothetical protein
MKKSEINAKLALQSVLDRMQKATHSNKLRLLRASLRTLQSGTQVFTLKLLVRK